MGRLDNKVVIVTGGNSGIGKKTAEVLCEEGAKVVISGRRHDENQRAVDEIKDIGGEISAIDADVSIKGDCLRVIEESIKKYGRIDVLVNNAGIADRNMPINLCTEDWYDKICKIDQYGVFYMCKYALVHMERRGKGSIVNISSIGSRGLAGIAYSPAKAAVNGMTKNIALQYSHTEIRCNAIAPGPTRTPLLSPEARATFNIEFAKACGKHIDDTVPRAETQDHANAVLFFASDESKSVTGQILYIDHGATLF